MWGESCVFFRVVRELVEFVDCGWCYENTIEDLGYLSIGGVVGQHAKNANICCDCSRAQCQYIGPARLQSVSLEISLELTCHVISKLRPAQED